MLHTKLLLTALLLVGLILSACQPITPPTAPEPQPPQGLRPDAPPYAVHGPYWVGYKPVVIGEDTDHPLNASLWYPALNPNGEPEEIVYPITWKTPSVPLDAEPLAYGHALLDAPVDKSAAPYPLVVFSHGMGSNPPSYANLVEHYASYGFIVLSPDHVEEFDWELSNLWKSFIDRPKDIKQTLDYAEPATAPGGDMAGLIDMQHVAVAGHSAGGYTTLAAAGAQYDLEAFNARCAAIPPDDPTYIWLCGPIVPHEADMAARAGLDPMPEGLWPSFGDPRVTAIIPMASDSYLFDQAGLAKITVPMMAIGGTADTGTPYEWGIGPAYQYTSSAKKALVALEGAEHGIAIASCEILRFMPDTPFGPFFCYDPVWDKDRAHDLMNHFTTAFLLAELKGDAEAAATLAPENVSFPGVEYQAEGYAPATAAASLDTETAAKIDAIVEKAMTDYPTPGFDMCVLKDGQVVYSKGFGLADVADNRPATPQSVLTQGSVTKSMTAMAIMRLAEQGLIDLDAPVTDYLPYFTMADDRYKEITVRMLLSHRSGMPDSPVYWPAPLDSTMNPLEQAVRDLSEIELLFAPDTDWSYSSYGYSALGAIIAAVAGKPFEEFMQEEWLVPLGMTHSTFIPADVDPVLKMTGYNSDEAGEIAPTPSNCDGRDASTCMLHANCEDMAKWAQLMLNKGELDGKQILTPASIDAMWTSLSKTPWLDIVGTWYGVPIQEYGLGWYVGEKDGHRLVGNAGAGDGFNSHLQFAPDDGLAAIAMDNWLDLETATGYPATFAATDALYLLLGIEPGTEPATQ